eukprot:3403174-Alexandrium_andersonii.AAC.1
MHARLNIPVVIAHGLDDKCRLDCPHHLLVVRVANICIHDEDTHMLRDIRERIDLARTDEPPHLRTILLPTRAIPIDVLGRFLNLPTSRAQRGIAIGQASTVHALLGVHPPGHGVRKETTIALAERTLATHAQEPASVVKIHALDILRHIASIVPSP